MTIPAIETKPQRSIQPKRLLSVWQPSAVVVGMVVGAGIFRTARC